MRTNKVKVKIIFGPYILGCFILVLVLRCEKKFILVLDLSIHFCFGPYRHLNDEMLMWLTEFDKVVNRIIIKIFN
jgi:hypothetical protein